MFLICEGKVTIKIRDKTCSAFSRELDMNKWWNLQREMSAYCKKTDAENTHLIKDRLPKGVKDMFLLSVKGDFHQSRMIKDSSASPH